MSKAKGLLGGLPKAAKNVVIKFLFPSFSFYQLSRPRASTVITLSVQPCMFFRIVSLTA